MTDGPEYRGSTDLLPTRPRARPARRGPRRKILVASGAAGLVVLALALLLVPGGDNDERKGSTAPSTVPHSGPRSGVKPGASTSTSTSSSTSTSASFAPPDAGAPEPAAPDQNPAPGLEQVASKITLTQNPDSCTWDAATGDLLSSGTVASQNADSYRVSVSVTWFAADGTELAGAADQWSVDPGGDPVDWALSGSSDGPASGLRCEASFEVLY